MRQGWLPPLGMSFPEQHWLNLGFSQDQSNFLLADTGMFTSLEDGPESVWLFFVCFFLREGASRVVSSRPESLSRVEGRRVRNISALCCRLCVVLRGVGGKKGEERTPLSWLPQQTPSQVGCRECRARCFCSLPLGTGQETCAWLVCNHLQRGKSRDFHSARGEGEH